MAWTYREFFAEVDRRERRKVGLAFAVLVASGYSVAEAQTIARGQRTLTASASADPATEPVSFDSLGAILAAIARETPKATQPPDNRIARNLGLTQKGK